MPKTQRIRDVIYDLIVFRESSEIDQLAWSLINTREFQRLRRIRQLGLSEFVYPGATHTRFSHCIGAYHAARKLLELIKPKLHPYDSEKAEIAQCAALLHDVGHGPFSHTFEAAEKLAGHGKRHESWSAAIIAGDTEIHKKLVDSRGEGFAAAISQLLSRNEPTDIYSAIVSSQFDADRLDYIRRDRYMTGTGTGHFDFGWLLDCLEVGKIFVGDRVKGDIVEVDSLYINYKGLKTAEEYLLARFNLYSQVYTHKTTRGAEKLLAGFLLTLRRSIIDRTSTKTGIPDSRPLVKYLEKDFDLSCYLMLDDNSIWSALSFAQNYGGDSPIAMLARGLIDRRLFKCFDTSLLLKGRSEDALLRFRKSLNERLGDLGLIRNETFLTDEFKISPYGFYRNDEPGALQKVLVGDFTGKSRDDIATQSDIVASIVGEKRVFRVYVPDAVKLATVENIWREVNP
jgi:hypothetical protein